MTKYAIQVENLGKEYILGGAEQRHDSFREMLTGSLTAPFRKLRKLGGMASEAERFWALKDVSFQVKQGEVLGIIGRNGAGKSTLLKVLSRITSPTEGRVVTRGRVASLLEVGTGFHPELTGRENIYLNGAILGMARAEIDTQFDEIIAFAEVEKFLDTPVKRYSSGMYVRLAFSVAAHLNVDILVVDEVLAVGDEEFQKKCLGKMSGIADTGKTVLFVSHNMNAIARLCERAILLRSGLIIKDDNSRGTIDTYLTDFRNTGKLISIETKGPLSSTIDFTSIKIINSKKGSAELRFEDGVTIVIEGVANEILSDVEIVIGIDSRGLRVCSLHDSSRTLRLKKGRFQSTFQIFSGQLRPGSYSLSIGAYRQLKAFWCWSSNVATLDIQTAGLGKNIERDLGVVNILYDSERKQF